MAELMTPDHPRWDEFAEILEGPEYCDFREKEPGNAESITWRCEGGMNKPYAKVILEKMGGFDVASSLKYFEEHGGHCDCEILMNVQPITFSPEEIEAMG